jgi:Xaa-Pro aminopeptidase
MKQIYLFLILPVILNSTFVSSQTSFHQSFADFGIYDTDGIKPHEYQQRRAAVMAMMDSCSIAIFLANNPVNRNGDTDYKYRQNDNFLYLTGCNETNSTLILAPNGIHVDSITIAKEILFVDEYKKTWSGYNLGLEGAKHILGFGDQRTYSMVFTTEKLKKLLPQIMKSKAILSTTQSLPEILFDPISDTMFSAVRAVRNGLKEKYPNCTVKSSEMLVNELRSVKSSAEILIMQKAIDATVYGCIEAMKTCTSNKYEYELQAVIEYCFTRSGCEFYGFPSIIGSGPNTLSFHYIANRRQMKSGELVVMDIGAEYHGYSADVTRTIPVNGTFSPAQREIYELVLKAQNSAIKEVLPYMPMNASGEKAMDILGEGLVKLGIIRDKSEVKKYCPHGISHLLGLDVHDAGTIEKLVPGMVLTVEPGIYISDSSTCDKKYWGIGIRIEDDILVTEKGCKILSEAAPRTVDTIELLMKQEKNIEIMQR